MTSFWNRLQVWIGPFFSFAEARKYTFGCVWICVQPWKGITRRRLSWAQWWNQWNCSGEYFIRVTDTRPLQIHFLVSVTLKVTHYVNRTNMLCLWFLRHEALSLRKPSLIIRLCCSLRACLSRPMFANVELRFWQLYTIQFYRVAASSGNFWVNIIYFGWGDLLE